MTALPFIVSCSYPQSIWAQFNFFSEISKIFELFYMGFNSLIFKNNASQLASAVMLRFIKLGEIVFSKGAVC